MLPNIVICFMKSFRIKFRKPERVQALSPWISYLVCDFCCKECVAANSS